MLTIAEAIAEKTVGQDPMTAAEIAAEINADRRTMRDIDLGVLESLLITRDLLAIGLDGAIAGPLVAALEDVGSGLTDAERSASSKLFAGLLSRRVGEVSTATDSTVAGIAGVVLGAMLRIDVMSADDVAAVLGLAGGYRSPLVTDAAVAASFARTSLLEKLSHATAATSAALMADDSPTETKAKAAFDAAWSVTHGSG